MTKSDQVAVFWDYENARVWAEGIQVPLAEKLMTLVEQYGHARILRVYAKWGGNETTVQGLYSMGFQPIHVPMGKKNSVDVMLAVDCINCSWEHPEISIYFIVSGDKDYISVVNHLKSYGKHVVIIGPSEITSEHLQLSANEFYSFKDLADEGDEALLVQTELISDTISYDDAVNCLITAIEKAKEQGKITRFPVIDLLMRADKRFSYKGYQSISGPDGIEFKSFSSFVKRVEEEGKVVVFSTGEFAELFLSGDDPKDESSYVSSVDTIEQKDWELILGQIEKAFEEGDPTHYLYGRYQILRTYIRTLKKNHTLNVSNSTITSMLDRIIEEGLLIRQANESYRLAEDYKEKKKKFLEQVGN